MRATNLTLLLVALLVGCPPSLGDDDDLANDDDVVGDDDDATSNDDDVIGDDDDLMDDDDSVGDDDDATPCGLRDLELSLEARDLNGVAGLSFTTAEQIVLVGTLANPCPIDVAFQTNTGCLLDTWTLTGTGSGEGRGCDDAFTNWEIPAGEAIEDAAPVGPLQADDWTWLAGFLDTSMSLTFTVQ